jgi:hypothetical protein
MPRATIAKTSALGQFGDYSVANAADLVETAANVGNKNQFLLRPRDLLIAHNIGVGAQTVTLTSVEDEHGRTKDVTAYSIGAGEIAVFGPFLSEEGWMQPDGYVYVEANSADVKFSVVQLPAQ